MDIKQKPLLKIAIVTSAVWVAAQIALIACFWGCPQKADMGDYISMARRCFANGEWYPMAEDIYSVFIHAPGFINYLILQLHIFGTTDFNAVINLFLNIAMLFEIYYLGKKFFSKRTGLISAVIFCLLSSNLLMVLGANTENPFLFLCLSALCLVFSGKWKYIVLAAVLFALANWVRPLAVIFLFASIVYFVITKTKIYNYIALIIPYIIALFIIGAATEKKIGYFVYQSTTSGYNLLIAAHDKTGGGRSYFYENNVGSLAQMGNDIWHAWHYTFIDESKPVTFAEKDSIWKAHALKRIKERPGRYIAMFFMNIPRLYIHDGAAGLSHFNESGLDILARGGDMDGVKKLVVKIRINRMLLSIPYYLAFLFFFYAMWVNRKEILSVKSVFLAILVSGIVVTCIFSANQRYHYPFIFPVIIYAAWGVDTVMGKLAGKKPVQC